VESLRISPYIQPIKVSGVSSVFYSDFDRLCL
jgi:hypothetical protein